MRLAGTVSAILDAVLLVGEHVRLEPLERRHADGLAAAAADGDVWRKWTTAIPAPEDVPAEIDRRIAAHEAGRIGSGDAVQELPLAPDSKPHAVIPAQSDGVWVSLWGANAVAHVSDDGEYA